jgi:hypothetical protein
MVRAEQARACTKIVIERSRADQVTAFDWNDLVCHGWSTQYCTEQLVVIANGVTADGAVAVRALGRRIDLVSALDEELARHERDRVHLRFLQAQCEGDDVRLPFEGSTVGRGQDGPAQTLTGSIVVPQSGNPAISTSL